MATGFANSFTSGEICDDAWDRTDIQPVAKGCEQAENYVIRITGPLGKRRGFWDLGDAFDSASKSKLIPFRRSVDDALMLEFSNATVRVWNNDGTPYPDGIGGQVQFGSPYSEADLDGLRYKQVNDVIQFRTRAGLLPLALKRTSNTSWAFAPTLFAEGPWRPENLDKTFTVAVAGVDEADANPDNTAAGCITVGTAVTLVASAALFDPAMVGGGVGAYFRLRGVDGAPSVASWKPGFRPTNVGSYCTSNGRVYKMTSRGLHDEVVTNPPTQDNGSQSDGGCVWLYRHDGAGIVQITAVTDAQNASGVVTKALPFRSGTATTYFAEGAYSVYRGWPRMWPGLREERFVEGATASNLDFVDLTQTAGFQPYSETFIPGLGSGAVVATDAVRRRVGDDGAEILWAAQASYLVLGTASGEYLLAGGVLDEAITPSSVTLKGLSEYGSADVYPAKAHKALIHVTRGAKTLRELSVDTQQNANSDDLTVLAQHIAVRAFAQLAWVPQPDENLWLRLNDTPLPLENGTARPADGQLAVMTYHKEQAVRGFASVALPGGWTCENLAVLPGPGRLETLWGVFSRVKDGGTQRRLWMQSQATDALFVDCAQLYVGAPATAVAGLMELEGETVRIVADGAWQGDQEVVGGQVHIDPPASRVQVGLPYKARFKSLKLDRSLGGSLNTLQRVVEVTVSLKTADARVGLDGGLMERVTPRTAADVPAMGARRTIRNVTIGGDSSRDPRLVIEDDSPYDGVIYSLKPKVQPGE